MTILPSTTARHPAPGTEPLTPTPGVDAPPVFLDDRRIVRALVGVAATLFVLGVVSWATRGLHFPGRDFIGGAFSPGGEANVPATFSSALLLLIAGLLAAVAHLSSHSAFQRVWRGLAWVFVYLTVDEFAQLHERTVDLLRRTLGESATSGILHHAWVLPYALFVLVTFSVTLRFLSHLPGRTRTLFIVAGVLYVGGALGFELLEGPVSEARQGQPSVLNFMLVSAEELLEMTGAIVMISALLGYLRTALPGRRLELALRPRDQRGA